MLETVLLDIRYGLRMLIRNASAAAVTVLALALGIGVCTAVFTAYRAMVARPIDAHDSGRMVNVGLVRESNVTDTTFSYTDYQQYRASLRSLNGLVAFRTARVTLSQAGTPINQRVAVAGTLMGRLGLVRAGIGNAEFAIAHVVSENYFRVLGVNLLQGRSFDTPLSVLISENYWQRRFAADPSVLGKTLFLNGQAVTVAGIAPHDFVGTSIGAPAFWVPAGLEPLLNANDRWLTDRENKRYRLFGRLASGASIAQVQQEMDPIANHLRTLHDPHSDAAKPVTALAWPGSPFPLPLSHYRGLNLSFLLILTAAGLVLAVACANVGSMQLARVRSRENELRTRISLGAGRGRVIRQLLTESSLVGLSAGLLAFFLSWIILKAAVAWFTNALPVEFGALIFDVTPNPWIFALVTAISLAAGILSGLAPAWESSRSALVVIARSSTSSVRSRRLQNFLVAAQVALSFVLMIAGSMAIRSSIRLLSVDPGYEAQHVIALELQYPEARPYLESRKTALVNDLRTRLSGMAEVSHVSSGQPPGNSRFRTIVAAQANAPSAAAYFYIEPSYFETLGIPVILGQTFERGADAQAATHVILSETAAKKLWPNQNPIGRPVRLGPVDEKSHPQREVQLTGPAYQVIGVVRDVRGVQFDDTNLGRVYLPLPETRRANYPILIRTKSDPEMVLRALDTVITSVDSNLLATAMTLQEMLRQSPPFFIASFAAAIASTIGFFGLVLASLGIYGTVSYVVVLRTREVGIRMAIGAQKLDVLQLILRESVQPVMVGMCAGALLASGASYLSRGLLYGLDGPDPVALAAVSGLFFAIAMLASYAPSRRAMRIDPMVALRYE